MEMSQSKESLGAKRGGQVVSPELQRQFEDRFNQLRADIAERPFFYSAIAFIAGFVSNTFPARVLFLIIMRIVSWLLGPAILLLGVIKLSDLFSSLRRDEPVVLERP